MLASGPAVLAALLALQGATEFEAGARVEARAGEVPLRTGPGGTSSQRQVILSATPLLGVRWSGEESEARALSSTRIFWRPAPLLKSRPLFLEMLDTSFIARPNPRGRFQLDLRGSYGEEDYTFLSQQLVNQPALPPALTLLNVSASGNGFWRQTRRTTSTLLLGGTFRWTPNRQSVATPDGATVSVPALPTQAMVTTTPGVRYALDRRSLLELAVGIGEDDIRGFRLAENPSAHLNVFTVQPQIGLTWDFDRSQQLRAMAGLTYATVLVNPSQQQNWLPLTPLCRLELGSLLWRTRASALRSTLGAGTFWYVDPVLGAAVLRGTSEGRLSAQLGLRWDVSARVAFTTDLNSPLAPTFAGSPSPDETLVLVEVPFNYRLSTQLEIEFGARYAERAPNLWANDFAWHNREVWAFFSLLATTRQQARQRPATP